MELILAIVVSLALLLGLLWVGFRITGALLSAAFWLFFKLPLALMVFCLGLALCATLILIPIGIRCIGLTGRILF